MCEKEEIRRVGELKLKIEEQIPPTVSFPFAFVAQINLPLILLNRSDEPSKHLFCPGSVHMVPKTHRNTRMCQRQI
jgi:hypothetical protein